MNDDFDIKNVPPNIQIGQKGGNDNFSVKKPSSMDQVSPQENKNDESPSKTEPPAKRVSIIHQSSTKVKISHEGRELAGNEELLKTINKAVEVIASQKDDIKIFAVDSEENGDNIKLFIEKKSDVDVLLQKIGKVAKKTVLAAITAYEKIKNI